MYVLLLYYPMLYKQKIQQFETKNYVKTFHFALFALKMVTWFLLYIKLAVRIDFK